MPTDSSSPDLVDACLAVLRAARLAGSPTARRLAEALAFDVGLTIARDLVTLHGFTASRSMLPQGMMDPAAIHADEGGMADDADDPKETMIPFSTEPIARLMWADIEPALAKGALTFDVVQAALNRALITHLSQRAREAKRPH